MIFDQKSDHRAEAARRREAASDAVGVPELAGGTNTLGQRVYDALFQAIASQQLRPGTRLYPGELARRMGVSPMPVREAISRLAGEGLVTIDPRRGGRVATLGPDEVEDAFRVRLMCETFAAEAALPGITDDQLAELRARFARCAEAEPDADTSNEALWEFLQRDKEVHLYIVGLAGSPRLLDIYRALNVHVHTLRVLYSHVSSSSITRREHAEILAAYEARDPRRARAALTAHITKALNRIRPILGQRPGASTGGKSNDQ